MAAHHAKRHVFSLAKDFDKAIEAVGDDPADQYPVRDMIERMAHWCDLHGMDFDDEVKAGLALYRDRTKEERER